MNADLTRSLRTLTLSVAAMLGACAIDDANVDTNSGVEPAHDAPRAQTVGPDAGVADTTPAPLCERWRATRSGLGEAVWSGGAVATCSAGDIPTASRDGALRLVNFYRDLAGLAPLTMTAEGNRLAQACALLMRANGTITHTPPSSWRCHTAEAARTAGSSSLASQEAVGAVDGYMVDPGNPTTIGHRRWILSNWLTTIGFGSADRFSCQYQPAGAIGGRGGKAWVAWPPPGELPLQAFSARYAGTLDQTGWTVQSDSIDLRAATVTVTQDGVARPVTVTQLGANYGSRYALRFTPRGWTTTAGATYSVKVGGVASPIAYDVKVTDCR
ncbi:MAG: CAP domain-containing protein [Polyangiales bacterium]